MTKADWPLYVAPMAAFGVLSSLDTMLPHGFYPYHYAAKIVVVAVLTWLCSRKWKSELRWDAKAVVLGVVVGLVGLGLWLVLDHLQPAALTFGPKRVGYNPFTEITNPTLRAVFIGFRFFGLALIVPIIEEVFWRSFLLRFLTDQEKWIKLDLTAFTPAAFAAVAVAFAIPHPEWLAALAYAILVGGLLRYSKSLLACIVAHGVTNGALGIYVLMTGAWKYW